MKIAIVLDSLVRGGAERQAVSALSELVRTGRDVELIYYNRNDHNYTLSDAVKARITHLPKPGRAYLRFIWQLRSHFKRGGYDVVHGFMSSTSIYVGLAAWLARVPVVFAGIRVEYEDKGLIRLAHRLVNRIVTGWICNSEATVRSLLPGVGATPDRVHVVYNGIDPASFESKLSRAEAREKFGIDPTAPVVSIVARLSHQKNIPLFLQAAASIHSLRPATRFLIAGDGELRAEMERRCGELGLADVVIFLGIRLDIPDLLRATDIMTLTSHYEGLANTLLEAMAVGIPVVSTAYAGIEELLTDGREGYVVPLGDCEALTRRIVALIDDPVARSRLGECGRNTVQERFTISAMGVRLYSIYEAALARCNRI